MAARRPGSTRSATEPATAQIVRITRLGADGDGIAAGGDGAPVYVPLTLPGETVRVDLLERRGQGWAGTAAAILSPSPERVAPPCPHFGACGGCTLQHWRNDAYAAWKTGLLAAALQRAGFPDPPVLPLVRAAPGERRRIDLALRRTGGAVSVGLHRARSRDIVDLGACPVLHPDLLALVARLRAVLPGLTALRREGAAVLNLLDAGPDLLLRTEAEPSLADRVRLVGFARAGGLVRLSCAAGNGAPEPLCILRPPVVSLSGVAVAPPAGAFLQASRAGEAAIVAAVLAGLPAALPARARVADLYAGCGTLTFALAARARVSACEGDADALAALREAAACGGFDGRIEATVRDLARRPLDAREVAGFAAVVLDPPWIGAAAQVGQLAASTVGRVVYVSCNPAALARDAAILRDGGYRLLSAAPIDQFLWSARLESVSVFAR